MKKALLIIGSSLALSINIAVAQSIRYVEPDGEDLQDCTDPARSCMTIAYALSQADQGDTILIAEGVYTESDGLIIDKSISLRGAGRDLTIVQAHEEPEMASRRVVTIDGDFSVMITGMTIRHGVAMGSGIDNRGGGIYCHVASLTMDHVLLSKNKSIADGSTVVNPGGGGLYCINGSITLFNVMFSENVAIASGGTVVSPGGGGLYCINGSITLFNVIISENVAIASGGTVVSPGGGGLHCVDGSITLFNVMFNENFSQNSGAGLYLRNSSAVCSNLTIIGNLIGGAGVGGGMYSSLSDVTISDSGFINNFGHAGGGIWNNNGVLRLLNSFLIDNIAVAGRGGGISQAGDSLILIDVQISNNYGDAGGGVAMSNGSHEFTRVDIRFNTASAIGGGGIHNYRASPRFTDVFVESNLSYGNGGGMYEHTQVPRILTGITFRYNESWDKGGGLMHRGEALTVYDVIFEANIAREGGGFYIGGNDVIVKNCNFISNRAGTDGGGISLASGKSPQIAHVTFEGNTAYGGGGISSSGTFFERSSPLISNVTFIRNEAEYGAGISSGGYSKIEVKNTIFEDNSAEYGGGVYNAFAYGASTLTNAVFQNNTAHFGGGIYNRYDSITLVNTAFIDNIASEAGGAVYNGADDHTPGVKGKVSFINVTMSRNSAPLGGGMYNVQNGHIDVLNSICWQNVGNTGSEMYNDGTSSINLNYSIYRDEDEAITAGKGVIVQSCIQEDPLFLNTADGDFRLYESSPAINAGDPSTLVELFPGGPEYPLDLDQNPRIVGSRIDMGAFEWQGIVSIDEVVPELSVIAYPNPASDVLIVQAPFEIDKIEVHDLTGHIVLENVKSRLSECSVDIRVLPPGMYIARLISGRRSHAVKFVKE